MAADGQSDRMVSEVGVHVDQSGVIELLRVEEMAPSDIQQALMSVSGQQSVDVSTVRWWMMCFSSGDNDSRSPLLVHIFTRTACRLLFFTNENA